MTALLTPGNWDRASGNDVLARDSAGVLWLYAGNNAGGFGLRRAIGSGWSAMTYLGPRSAPGQRGVQQFVPAGAALRLLGSSRQA